MDPLRVIVPAPVSKKSRFTVIAKRSRLYGPTFWLLLMKFETSEPRLKKVVTIPLLDYLAVEIILSKMVSLIYKNVNWIEKVSLLLIFSKIIFHVPKCWRQNWTYGKHICCKVKIVI